VTRKTYTAFYLLFAGVVVLSSGYLGNTWAQASDHAIRHVRVLETDNFFDVVNLDGVVFPPHANTVLVLDQPRIDAATIVFIPQGGMPGDPENLSLEIADPINITFDSRGNRLFFFERKSGDLLVTKLGRKALNAKAIEHFNSQALGLEWPNGMAVDPHTGTLFVLDRVGPMIVEIDPGPTKNYDGAAALTEGRITKRFLIKKKQDEIRGLAFNPANGRLYTMSPKRQQLYEIAEDGQLIDAGSFSETGWIDPKGIIFAPSLDQTDDPGRMNLYIASAGGPSGHVSEWFVTPSVEDGTQQ